MKHAKTHHLIIASALMTFGNDALTLYISGMITTLVGTLTYKQELQLGQTPIQLTILLLSLWNILFLLIALYLHKAIITTRTGRITLWTTTGLCLLIQLIIPVLLSRL
ncbi:MAG: hypothetical protein HC945_00100 [Nitrosarchaeum sp.]|nr:hypothetical protein [Nitrosarchaeum sp.]